MKAFQLTSPEEAKRFDSLLAEYQRRRGAEPGPHISLENVFAALRGNPEGGRIFTYLLELQIQLAILNCDLVEIMEGLKREGSLSVNSDDSPLEDVDRFCAKTALLRANSDFIFRYRAIWDKVMAILVLLCSPEEFKSFLRSKSRKKAFRKIADRNATLPSNLVQFIQETITAFDSKYRTAEAHGSGSSRKWSYLYLEQGEGNEQDDMFWSWNSLNQVVLRLGRLFEAAARAGAAP